MKKQKTNHPNGVVRFWFTANRKALNKAAPIIREVC
jgi:hypothetical protein